MECKFLQHGLSIAYDQVAKPCCVWQYDENWAEQNHSYKVNLESWHNTPAIVNAQLQLKNGEWPRECSICQEMEKQGRADSMRGNGLHAYANYAADDLTLEIRPGSTCNFACQTCWPEASSRVADYQHRAGLIDITSVRSSSIKNFDFLYSIRHRIKSVILLGGEPFYDKDCLKFLDWAKENLSAQITMFTNGSHINYEFLRNYNGGITLVFSLDAIGHEAEYIRYGTIWSQVEGNYRKCQQLPNVELRVNVTCSIFNYWQLADLMAWLEPEWPTVVTFGRPKHTWLTESTVVPSYRTALKDQLQQCADRLSTAEIELGQKQNAVNAIGSIVTNLDRIDWSQHDFDKLKNYINRLDQVKNISVGNYLLSLNRMLIE